MKDRWTFKTHSHGDVSKRIKESKEVLCWSDEERRKNWDSLTKNEQLEWVDHIRKHAISSMKLHNVRGDEAWRKEMMFHQWMDGLPHDQVLEISAQESEKVS